jgi:hypothetical protein
MACATLFADGAHVGTVRAVWETIRPATYIDWIRSILFPKMYTRVLRYTVVDNKRLTHNAAIHRIVQLLETNPTGTLVGFSWNMYFDPSKPLREVLYTTGDDLKQVALPALIGLRDFYTDRSMTRAEQGD